MRATRSGLTYLAALVMTVGLVAGCSPPRRGNLAITVDGSGRIVALIALCEQDSVEVLGMSVANPGLYTGSRLFTFRPAPGTRPTELVLSSSEPGPDWLATGPTLHPGPTPVSSADVAADPRTSTAEESYSLSGRTTSRGSMDYGGNIPSVHYVPQQVTRDPRLRDGQVLSGYGNVMSRADFDASPSC